MAEYDVAENALKKLMGRVEAPSASLSEWIRERHHLFCEEHRSATKAGKITKWA